MATSDDFSKREKGFALVIGFIECLLFGGVMYGWADLIYVMKAEGIFSDKCVNVSSISDNNNGSSVQPSCKKQDDLFDEAFTIASIFRSIGVLFVSLLLDYAGLRITRLVAICSIILGGFFTGYCSKVHPYFLFPASILIALGGIEIRLADFKIANMFPKYKATVMSIYNGAFSGSGAVFLALKYVYDDDKDRPLFMYVWTGIAALMFFPTFLLLPKWNIEAIDEAELLQQPLNDNDNDDEQLLPLDDKSVNREIDLIQNNSILLPLRTFSYWLHVYSASNAAVGITLYVGSFNQWANEVTTDKQELSKLSEVYGYCQLPMIVVAPLVGIVMDYAVKRALEEPEYAVKRKKLQQAGFFSLLCLSISITLLTACKIFTNILSIKLSLFVYTIAYPTTCAVVPGYLRIRFHQDHFNKLMGIMGIIVAIYCTIQFPLFSWMERDPFLSNVVIAALMGSTLLNSLHLLCLKVS